MSKPKLKLLNYKTPAQLRAQAALLAGTPSRAAQAAADVGDDSTPAGTVGELWLYGVVGGWWRGFNAESVAEALRKMDVDHLFVRIHSPGGYAADGVAIGNLLRNHRAQVTVVVDGLAASAASAIAVAGDQVVMCPGAQMMLHDASTGMWGNAAELRRAADWIDGQSANYAGVYAYKAGGTPESWREVMLANEGDGTWYTAQGAVDVGLADEVGTRVASGSPPTNDDDEFDDEDSWAALAHDLAILEQHVPPAARAAWQGKPAPAGRSGAPKPPTASAEGSTHTEGGSAMSFSDSAVATLRTKLGVTAEDADEATILAALDEALDERSESGSDTTIPEGHVVIPKAKLDDLTAGADAGRKAAQALHERERDDFLAANATKYAATNRAAWAKEYDRDPEGTRKHFATAPDLVPVNELGHEIDEAPATATLDDIHNDATYKNWSI